MQLTVQALRRETFGRPHRAARAAQLQHRHPLHQSRLLCPGVSSDPLSSHKYVAFEDLFRGDRSLIRERQMDYVKLFAGRQDVLDIGCGRGEFLQLLAEHGISGARHRPQPRDGGPMPSPQAWTYARRTLLSFLREQDDGSFGGLIAAQVVEHLEPDYLLAFVDEAFRVLRPGSPIVLETINVTSWSAFFTSYLRDLTHVRPVHPDTLKFVVIAAGFLEAEIQTRAPLPDSEKLLFAPRATREVNPASSGPEGQGLAALADAFDRNMERLNTQLYGPLDYAVVAWKP